MTQGGLPPAVVIEGAQRLVEAASTPTGDRFRPGVSQSRPRGRYGRGSSRHRQEAVADGRRRRRVLVDVLVGHILGSENDGQGAPTTRVEPRLRTARASHLTPMNRRRQRDVG